MTKGKKIALIVIIVIAVLITVFVIAVNYIGNKMMVVDNLVINDVDLSLVSDGVYFGKYESILVKAEVEVEVKDNKIVSVKILKHSHGKGEDAEIIVNNIVDEQKINIDTISGATTSSKVILKAVENALTD